MSASHRVLTYGHRKSTRTATAGTACRASSEFLHSVKAAERSWQRPPHSHGARGDRPELGSIWLKNVRDTVPQGYTREAIHEAIAIAPEASIVDTASAIGNGSGVTCTCT